MDLAVRIILRFLLVPLGYLAAVVVGTFVILFGSWRMGDVAAATNSDGQVMALFGFMFAGTVLLFVLLSVMWLIAAIGILMAEGFAIRSWMYHAANGAVSAWLCWSMFGFADETHVALNEPLPVIAAGIAGGFVYWAIAGWSSGPWKPVFALPVTSAAAIPASPSPPPAPTVPTAPPTA